MTIIFVTHYTGLYGANRSMLTLIQLLRSRYAIHPIVLIPYSEGPLLDLLKESDIQYYVESYSWWVLTYFDSMPSKRLNLKQQLRNIFCAFRLKKLFKGQKIDAVYTNSVTINIGSLLAFILQVPHVWHFRESIGQFGLKMTMPPILSKLIINLPTNKRFVLLSDFMIAEYRNFLPTKKVRRIYNGVSLPKGIKQRFKNQMCDGILQIACVGNLCIHKNQLELLKALQMLREKNIVVHAHFVGVENPEYLEEMNTYIRRNNIEEMVTIHGHTDNVFAILETCNLGVVTARDEAFGRVTIEYMLMKMPVVASDSGANPELVDDGITGMIYHLGNVLELADSIRVYANNPTLIEQQGENAYTKAVSEFSAEKNADLIYSEVEKIICV